MPTATKKAAGTKSEGSRSLPITPQDTVHHVYNHFDDNGAHVSVKVERNSRGYNWEAGVSGAQSVDEAIALLTDAEAKLKKQFGEPAKGEDKKEQQQDAQPAGDNIPF